MRPNLFPAAAKRSDVSDLATLAAAATWDSPVAAWLVSDVDERAPVLHAWYTMTIERALDYGHVDMTLDRRGVAVWLDRTRPRPAPAHYLRRLAATCGRHAAHLLLFEAALDRNRPRCPHMQLTVLAPPCDDDAAELLAHRHEMFDRIGLMAYGFPMRPDLTSTLAAAGYQLDSPYLLVPGGPELTLMRRPPANTGSRSAGTWPSPESDLGRTG